MPGIQTTEPQTTGPQTKIVEGDAAILSFPRMETRAKEKFFAWRARSGWVALGVRVLIAEGILSQGV